MTREEYALAVFGTEDDILRAVRQDIADRHMPSISVHPGIGQLLAWLIQLSGSRHVLEIGALGGYSGIWMARALPEDGRLTSLEINPDYADVARRNLERAGVAHKATYRIGPAEDTLARLEQEGARFDFFLIDADKPGYPAYLEWAVRLAQPGAVIAADNALLGDAVLSDDTADESAAAIRRFNRRMAEHPRLVSLLLPAYDGLSLARVVT